MERPFDLTVEELLAEAAAYVVDAPGMEPWNHGWFVPEYRESDSAALGGSGGPVTIAPSGRSAYERAVDLLGREQAVRERWGGEELWGVVASLVVSVFESDDPKASIQSAVRELRAAPTNLVLLPLANVVPPPEPITVDDSVIAPAGDGLRSAVDACANGRPVPSHEAVAALAETYNSKSGPLVVFACWSRGQQELAIQQAENRLRTVLDVALLLEPEPGDLGLHSLRGSTNRPGVRGVTIHRPALDPALAASVASTELAAEIAIVRRDRVARHLRWNSTDPFPLAQLLALRERRQLVERCLRESSPISRRARMAARWFAEAHWADDKDDALVALGIALDALIGARSGLPGRAMRERFALLEKDIHNRSQRARRYSDISSARSALVHGGASALSEDAQFVRAVATDVVWTAYRMLEFEKRFAPPNEKGIDNAFEELRWGTATWF